MSTTILTCTNLNKRYSRKKKVLNNFSCEIPGGKIIGLLGPNGCGKSTFMKLVCGLLAPDSGEITVCVDGAGIPFSEELAKKILLEKEIQIIIGVGNGNGEAVAWGCDLTYDYVKINGDYRT